MAGSISVLVVDDSPVVRQVLSKLLAKDRDIGAVQTAATGNLALRKLKKFDPDVVTMDVEMPHMDGISATAAIRGHQDVKRQPFIIALTANATTEDRRKCLEGGMDDYASKPVSTEILGRLLEKATVAQRMRHGSLLSAS